MADFTDKHVFYITDTNRKRVMRELYDSLPVGWKITITPPGRTLDQNAKLWPMLDDIARQVVWYGEKLSREDWKDVLTASLKRYRVVPGTDGGFVACGLHTSQMSKRDFSELIELIYAFGAEQKVVWSEKAQTAYDDYLYELNSKSKAKNASQKESS